MIEIHNLTKSFGRKIVFQNLNLEVKDKEMVAIMGASGSGKSTLLNILGLIDGFDSGSYIFDGQSNIKPNSTQASREIRNKINYIFQNFALIDNQTVAQNLTLAQKYVRKDKAAKIRQIDETLRRVGLEDYKDSKVYELSGGQQQRVAVARAMIKPSQLILADEPTGSLDEQNRDIIMKELRQLNMMGKTLVIVTHDPVVADYCSKIIKL
ncbi:MULTISPECIES: ABC transporter ATP-binding protein [unclassified Lactobacillus]|uniref:ABC transporter ATP-binding protein n=1 Tax=unclassified Lactobacillus TaxID=2620435 RepID=UPI000EFDAA32|nr:MULTISPECIES: ABC transporter ATP-binding protein [unclassified Lactobacillus]RMC24154.1 ABC transporter ATP-binding protein [Lactobacillus sp. ESL0247]RMC28727.1 ABC transporter ATP-binding protein [Lactobacillus sp. ESL0246]RMC31384.1 ABC transporter ATP-binding protein [Lactobacillus sp. ESL0245]